MSDTERRIELALPSPSNIFTPAVIVILVAMIAGFALVNYAWDFTANYLVLSSAGIFSGKIWQLVTYPFIDTCPWTLIFNAILVLFIGSAIEREWRTGAFVLLWLVVVVVCGIVWVLVCRLLGLNYIGLGMTSCGFGLIAVFGVLFRGSRFLVLFWAVDAQHIALGLIAIGIIMGIPQPITWIWVSGALVAYLYVKLRLRAKTSNAVSGEQGRPRGFVDID